MRRFELRALVLGAVVSAAGLACGAAAWRLQSSLHANARRADLTQFHARVRDIEAEGASSRPDFVQQLPEVVLIEPVVSQLQRSGDDRGIVLVSVSTSQGDANTQSLRQVQLTVGLRGSYSGLKPVLAELLVRFPGLTLRRLSFRRSGAVDEIDANAELLLFALPRLDLFTTTTTR